MDAIVDSILEFWFGNAAPPADELPLRLELWVQSGAEVQREVAHRFGESMSAAAAGDLDGWVAAPRSALALVLLLDQFPRMIHRGTAEAYAADARARAACIAAVTARMDEKLHPLETVFLYLPLQHSESAAHQERAVHLLDKLARRVDGEQRELITDFAEHARRYRALIRRFGRFPHRNAALGRASTSEERAYLEAIAAGGEAEDETATYRARSG